MWLWKSVPSRNIEWDWTSALTIRDWREQSEAFEDMALVLRPEGSIVRMHRDDGPPLKLQASIVSGNFFDVLGAAPLFGRTFSPIETQRGENVAVLSYRLWRQQFGGSQSIPGKTIRIDERSVATIGVMAPEFEFPDKDAQLWLLLSADPRWPAFQMPRFRIADAFFGLARLKPGKTLAQARAGMKAVSARLAEQYPATDKGLSVRVVSLFEQVAGSRVRGVLWTLGAAAVCVRDSRCSWRGARQSDVAVRVC